MKDLEKHKHVQFNWPRDWCAPISSCRTWIGRARISTWFRVTRGSTFTWLRCPQLVHEYFFLFSFKKREKEKRKTRAHTHKHKKHTHKHTQTHTKWESILISLTQAADTIFIVQSSTQCRNVRNWTDSLRESITIFRYAFKTKLYRVQVDIFGLASRRFMMHILRIVFYQTSWTKLN